MKRILVIADAHGVNEVIDELNLKYADIDLKICLGDTYLNGSGAAIDDYINIRGNNDSKFENNQIVKVEQVSFYITHGHLEGVDFGLEELAKKATSENCQVALFGHLHYPVIEEVSNSSLRYLTKRGKPFGRVVCINPGSVAWPRRIKTATYAIIEVTTFEITVKILRMDDHREYLIKAFKI